MNDLIVLEDIKPVEIFGGGGLDDLLKKIAKEANSVVPDTETVKGRKEIASMANKVAKSKTYLDGLGKDLVSDWKQKAKIVDQDRKKMRDYLDSLKEKVRSPLTEWEQAEETRLNLIKEKIDYFHTACTELDECTSKELSEKLEAVKNFSIDDSFEEFANEAAKNKDLAISVIESKLAKTIKLEQEQIELEKLRKEAEERAQKDREEQLRREGEEKARREAEAKALEAELKAKAEQKAAIEAKERAEQAAKEAELRAKQAADNAAREAEEAAKRERDRIESERIAEEAAAKKREADKAHRKKINNAAMEALVAAGLTDDLAKIAVTAIAKGQVPYIKISY